MATAKKAPAKKAPKERAKKAAKEGCRPRKLRRRRRPRQEPLAKKASRQEKHRQEASQEGCGQARPQCRLHEGPEPSDALAAIIGKGPIRAPRSPKDLDYIKKNKPRMQPTSA